MPLTRRAEGGGPAPVPGSEGFTLLEILVTILITSLLVAGAIQAHIKVLEAQRERVYERGRDVTAARVLDRMERELLSTLLVAKPEALEREEHPWVFQGTDGGNDRPDAIRFVTTRAGQAGEQSAGLRLVAYSARFVNDPGRDELYRIEEPLPLGLPEPAEPRGLPSLEDIALFQLRYLNPETATWEESWDSTEDDSLPEAVEITLQLSEPDEDGEPGDLVQGSILTRVVPLLVRPIVTESNEDGCSVGLSLEQCLMQPSVQEKLVALQNLPEDERQVLEQEIQSFGQVCLQDPDVDLQPLAPLIETLEGVGVDFDQECMP